MPSVRNTVLADGAWADGSSWSKLIQILIAKGFNVSCMQNTFTSLADDIAAIHRITQATTQRALLSPLVKKAAWGYQTELIRDRSPRPNYSPEQERGAAKRMKSQTHTLPTSHVAMHVRSVEIANFMAEAAASLG